MAASTEPRRVARFHGIPPAPGWRAEFGVLDDFRDARGVLGLALWDVLRDTALWTRTADGARPGLFRRRPGFRAYAADALAAHAPELADAWARLDGVSRAPADVARDALADACRAVYAWAEERALMRTAAHFAEAAALVKPDAPELANLAARTCRRAALPERSGPWYQRGGRSRSAPTAFRTGSAPPSATAG